MPWSLIAALRKTDEVLADLESGWWAWTLFVCVCFSNWPVFSNGAVNNRYDHQEITQNPRFQL